MRSLLVVLAVSSLLACSPPSGGDPGGGEGEGSGAAGGGTSGADLAMGAFGDASVEAALGAFGTLPAYSLQRLSPAGTYAYVGLTDVTYNPGGTFEGKPVPVHATAHKLDVWRPVDKATGAPLSGIKQVIVLIHGGGFVTGDKSQLTSKAQHYASMGALVFNINYRHLGGQGNAPACCRDAATGELTRPYPQVLPPDAYLFPAHLNDVQLAVRWVKVNAGSHGAPPLGRRIVAAGYSAGANLATMLAAMPSTYASPDGVHTVLASVSSQPNAAVGHSTPSDLRKSIADYYETGCYVPGVTLAPGCVTNNNELQGERAYLNVMGDETPDHQAAKFSEASPVKWVASPGAKPMALSQGSRDSTVLPLQRAALTAALDAGAIPTVYTDYEGGHVFMQLSTTALNPGTGRPYTEWEIADPLVDWAFVNGT